MERPRRAKGSRGSRWPAAQPRSHGSQARLSKNGCVTVGTSLNVKHLAATPVGMKAVCRTKLLTVDGRRLVFEVEVEDEVQKIGEGTHERFVVQAEKFQAKADAKLK